MSRTGTSAGLGPRGRRSTTPRNLAARFRLWLRFVFALLSVPAVLAGVDDQRLPGKFVWTELVTYDLPVSEKFYGSLFGWQFEDHEGYRVAWHGEEAIGGLVQRPRNDPEAKSRWIAYMSIEDMAAAKATLADAGARMIADSRNVDGLGELAVFADAEGALFGIIDTAGPDPGDYLADVNTWIWLQLFARDPEQASQFYEPIGGYQPIASPNKSGTFLLVREGYARAAISSLPPRHPEAQPSWLPFLRVADIDATLAQSAALGGKTLVAPGPELYDNRVAVIEAPDGSAVGILLWKPQVAEGTP